MIYRIDMATLTVRCVEEGIYQELGGCVLSTRLIHNEVDVHAHPLGEQNKLVFATGLLSGTSAPSAGRLSLAARSPQTGAIKESNAGGTMGYKLGRLGIRCIVVEGLPQKEVPYILRISHAGVDISEMPEVKGLNVFETVAKLQGIFGTQHAIACISGAGENKMACACIGFTDMEGVPVRQAGRGGLGAVMGSKGIKAVIVDDSCCRDALLADTGAFKAGYQQLVNALVRNSDIRQSFLEQTCSPGCFILCPGETSRNCNWVFNLYLGIKDTNDVKLLNRLCDDYGIDIFEVSAAIGVMMKVGMAKYGDMLDAVAMLNEVKQATLIGRVIGAGAEVTSKVFGQMNTATYRNRKTSYKRTVSSVVENAGLCKFVASALEDSPEGIEGIVQMCNARYGWQKTFESFQDKGVLLYMKHVNGNEGE